jgi:pantothenate synthetase
MAKQTIATEYFSDAAELADALKSILETLPEMEIVYVASNGFLHTGRIVLIEETLTDRSKVYNIEIGQS